MRLEHGEKWITDEDIPYIKERGIPIHPLPSTWDELLVAIAKTNHPLVFSLVYIYQGDDPVDEFGEWIDSRQAYEEACVDKECPMKELFIVPAETAGWEYEKPTDTPD